MYKRLSFLFFKKKEVKEKRDKEIKGRKIKLYFLWEHKK